jgi:hypothetical protein
MSRSLTASDRSNLIRLASSLPAGSAERKAILASLGPERLADWSLSTDLERSVKKSSLGKTSASAKAILRYQKLETHLKSKGDQEGLDLLDALATAMGI